jgi:hypothetical protein
MIKSTRESMTLEEAERFFLRETGTRGEKAQINELAQLAEAVGKRRRKWAKKV